MGKKPTMNYVAAERLGVKGITVFKVLHVSPTRQTRAARNMSKELLGIAGPKGGDGMSIREWLDKRIAELKRELTALKQFGSGGVKKLGQPQKGVGLDTPPWRPFG